MQKRFIPGSRQFYSCLKALSSSVFICLVLALVINLTLANQVQAQHPLLLEEKSPITGWDEWGISITPYAWLAGQSSDVGGEKLRQSFKDLASITDVGFQARLLARWRRLTLVVDYTYADQASDSDIGAAAIDMALKQHILDMKLGGIVYDTRTTNQYEGMGIWVGAGSRYWDNDVDIVIKFRPILPGGSETIITESTGQTWWDPVLGIVLHFPVTSKIGFWIQATGGGLGIGNASDYVIDTEAAALFRLSHRLMLNAGYRLFKYDRTDDGINQKVTVSGPYIGLSIGMF